jgi:hypothetical protein
VRPAARSLAALATLCALGLDACGNAIQDQPIGHNILEGVLLAPYPVYWLGGSFEGLSITEVARDPGGATSIQYGDCVEGGQGTCVPSVRVVTSPDNSFLPGGAFAPLRAVRVRGVAAVLAQGGDTVEMATGAVVVDIYAKAAGVAAVAAQTIVPINATGEPQAPLPAKLPNSGFAETPLPGQVPSPLRPLR